jgi:hypothetical protein
VQLRNDFYIPDDRKIVQDYIGSCGVCQNNKTNMTQSAGLLQPLDVPSQVWDDISIDFIDALPRVHGKSVILTVVDRFSKYPHFIALSHSYTASPPPSSATVIRSSPVTCEGTCFTLQV